MSTILVRLENRVFRTGPTCEPLVMTGQNIRVVLVSRMYRTKPSFYIWYVRNGSILLKWKLFEYLERVIQLLCNNYNHTRIKFSHHYFLVYISYHTSKHIPSKNVIEPTKLNSINGIKKGVNPSSC